MKTIDEKTFKQLEKKLITSNTVLAQTCQTLNRLYEERQKWRKDFQAFKAAADLKTSEKVQHLENLFLKANHLEDSLKVMKLKSLLLNTKNKQLLAELENQRKIHHNVLLDLQHQSQKALLLEILKSVDLFELSLNFKTTHPETKSFLQGMQMVYKLFLKTLSQFAVQALPLKIGDQYDYHRHEAIKAMFDPKYKDQTVLSIEQKGYLLNKQILRQAKVVVNKYPTKTQSFPNQKNIIKGEKTNE